ncbi:MAG TPA: aspartate 1-decarboxylase [Bacteroidales bacterium]|nr:aspartate 1-decarboxylase [Bacteroidales bacterium]HNS47847.1 aspartate 1-decarboxylase [Bacteroidales bacterium]
MQIHVLKSKIHRATITDSNLNYMGSITIDEDLLDAAHIIENEQVHVLNVNNGERFVTYVIKGKRGSGEVVMNGAAARKVEIGDIILIVTYAVMDPEEAKHHSPVILFPDKDNKLQ